MSAWTFYDPSTSETYVFEISPNKMSSPYPDRQTDLGITGYDGRTRTKRTPTAAHEWVFSGVIRTIAQHDALHNWAGRGVVHLNDHLGRTFEVLPKSFAPEEQRPSQRTPHRFNYEMRVLVLKAL